MRPWILLLAMMFFFAACERKPAPSGTPTATDEAGGDPTKPKTPAKREFDLPKTGIERLQRDHAGAIAMLEAEEKKKVPDERTLRQIADLLDVVQKALEIAVKHEARNSLKHEHGLNRQRLAGFVRRRDALLREKQEIQQIRADAAKGVSPIPSGFTEAELKDKIADLDEAMREIKKERDQLVERMQKQEKLLASGETIPPRKDSMAAIELRNVIATAKRVAALLSR